MNRLSFLAIAFLTVGITALSGCEARKVTSQKAKPVQQADESQALAPLESFQDSAQCRTALTQLDALPSANDRPTISEADRAELGKYLQLTPAEIAEVAQTNFTSTDGMYLSEALLIRTGVRALHVESKPPLEQARLSFEWICRTIYIDDRVPAPVNPWLALETGWGIGLSRVYAVLATWQQLGLDGCVVGPATLKSSPSINIGTTPAQFAPVRSCGVKIGKDVFLFDATAGKPLPTADGKGILTLAAARAKPDVVASLGDEAKDWRPYLAPALSVVAPRMEWLQKLNPGNVGAKLYVDVRKQRAAFESDLAGIPIDAWNPAGDLYTPTRILGLIFTSESSNRAGLALRDQYLLQTLPLWQMPKTKLEGTPLTELRQAFAQPFDSLRGSQASPRELLIRGQLQDATTNLSDTRENVERARQRFEEDKTLQKDFDRWADQFRHLSAVANNARLRDPDGLPAALRALQEFRSTLANREVEQAFVLGTAARPLAAEVYYMTALCKHEQAERAHFDNPTGGTDRWRNAAEWWERYLDVSARANSPYPAREPHARALLERCRKFTGK